MTEGSDARWLELGGLAFVIEPASALTPAESESLRGLAGAEAGRAAETPPRGEGVPPVFRICLENAPPWRSHDPSLFRDKAPAVIRFVPPKVHVSHAAFTAALDFGASSARLFRARPESPIGLLTTLRTALAGRLPLLGGLPLHAAAIVMRGSGVAFFGPSGAGKSTLASKSPHPVLSDELVAVVPAALVPGPRPASGTPFAVSTTGFARFPSPLVQGAFPLRAVVSLEKGAFCLEALARPEALRLLLGVTSVPAAPPLWTKALEVVGALAAAVPCYRLFWSPDDPPFDRLASALGL